jgi:hypothetical protein
MKVGYKRNTPYRKRKRNRRNVCLIGMVNQNSKTGGLDFWDREEEKEN